MSPFLAFVLVSLDAFSTPVGGGSRKLAREPFNSIKGLSEHYTIIKTFNNGSLGSGIDEERSEMR